MHAPSAVAHLLPLLVLLLCGCAAGPGVETATPPFRDSLADGASGPMRFPTRDVAGFQALYDPDKTRGNTSVGVLHLPRNADATRPVPAMVILHGSGGEWSGRGREHAEMLAHNGVAAFVIDTFTGHGLTQSDRYIDRLRRVNMPDQLADAFAALALLRTHPAIDGTRIGLMGYSMGGVSTYLAAFEPIARQASGEANGARFALHVPFYAPPIILPEPGTPTTPTTGAPILALWGEADESTPRDRCRDMAAALEQGGSPVETVWYPGAAHGWNGHKAATFYKGFPNFAPCRYRLHGDGTLHEAITGGDASTDLAFIDRAEHCVEFGYTIGRNDNADTLSREALLRAIRTHMPAP